MDLHQQLQRFFSTPNFDDRTSSAVRSIYYTATQEDGAIPRELSWYLHDVLQEKKLTNVTFELVHGGKYKISLESELRKFTFKSRAGDPVEEIRYTRAGIKACEIAEILQLQLGLEATVLGNEPLQLHRQYEGTLRKGPAWHP